MLLSSIRVDLAWFFVHALKAAVKKRSIYIISLYGSLFNFSSPSLSLKLSIQTSYVSSTVLINIPAEDPLHLLDLCIWIQFWLISEASKDC